MKYKCNRCSKTTLTRAGVKCSKCNAGEAQRAGSESPAYSGFPLGINEVTSVPDSSSSSSFSPDSFSSGSGDFGGGGASGDF